MNCDQTGFGKRIISTQKLNRTSTITTYSDTMANFAIGTQVELVFRSQFVTFTADQFNNALKDKSYLFAPGQISDPTNPQKRFPIQTFSKGDMTVFLAPDNPPPIVFRIINTLNLESKYKEVKEVLNSLNMYSNIISEATFMCTTKALASSEPQERLTKMVDTAFVKKISENFGAEMRVFSIKLGSTFPITQEGCQLIIEPLMTNPENEYFLNITYRTRSISDFDKFVSEFGTDLIQRIIEETT